MKQFLKKHYKKIIIITFDILCVPIAIIFKILTQNMIANNTLSCAWAQLGFKCTACGGTHFVNNFLSFRFSEAFFDNQLLFVLAICFFITLILFNLWCIFNLKFAKKGLLLMYNIPSAILISCFTVIFTLWRNWDVIIKFITSI